MHERWASPDDQQAAAALVKALVAAACTSMVAGGHHDAGSTESAESPGGLPTLGAACTAAPARWRAAGSVRFVRVLITQHLPELLMRCSAWPDVHRLAGSMSDVGRTGHSSLACTGAAAWLLLAADASWCHRRRGGSKADAVGSEGPHAFLQALAAIEPSLAGPPGHEDDLVVDRALAGWHLLDTVTVCAACMLSQGQHEEEMDPACSQAAHHAFAPPSAEKVRMRQLCLHSSLCLTCPGTTV